MSISSYYNNILVFVFLFLLISSGYSVNFMNTTTKRLKHIRAYLKMMNKPPVKTIKSPDGDLIDCVLFHQQPAFDHPLLKGQHSRHPPEMPKGYAPKTDEFGGNYDQLWRNSNETCPENTVPIRRTTEEDVLRAKSVRTFGRKLRKPVMKDSNTGGNEHAVGILEDGIFYGAEAIINVWQPQIERETTEFSLSQIWLIAGTFNDDLNTIEAGWQVSPLMYGDTRPRIFTYWTKDAYQSTGCYNLLCSGFVQYSDRFPVGAAISPVSSYDGRQFDIPFLVWLDPKSRNWWLVVNHHPIGYWPSSLFTHLQDGPASMVEFGGEIVNSESSGTHTTTQMGSGHFAGEGFRKASYFRNLQVVDWENNLVPVSDLPLQADQPNCYNIQGWIDSVCGNYFYYGGPGKNPNCL